MFIPGGGGAKKPTPTLTHKSALHQCTININTGLNIEMTWGGIIFEKNAGAMLTPLAPPPPPLASFLSV